MITKGASVIRLKLKSSSLKTFESVEPPPLIRMKPKVSKLMISDKIRYLFLLKIMFFYSVHAKTERFRFFQKKPV